MIALVRPRPFCLAERGCLILRIRLSPSGDAISKRTIVLLHFPRNPAIELNTEPIKKLSVTIEEVREATDAKLVGDGGIPVADVTHDSRQAGQGSLFVAVRGELFDAHKFVPQVIEQGALGVLSEVEKPDDFNAAW